MDILINSFKEYLDKYHLSIEKFENYGIINSRDGVKIRYSLNYLNPLESCIDLITSVPNNTTFLIRIFPDGTVSPKEYLGVNYNPKDPEDYKRATEEFPKYQKKLEARLRTLFLAENSSYSQVRNNPLPENSNQLFIKEKSVFAPDYASEFYIHGQKFLSLEQYTFYQKALLFGKEALANVIISTHEAKVQNGVITMLKKVNSEGWLHFCPRILYLGTYSKFSQHPDLRKELLELGDGMFIYTNIQDNVLGTKLSEHYSQKYVDNSWKGYNWLGVILGQVRDDLITLGL